jgi:hypothetical protein
MPVVEAVVDTDSRLLLAYGDFPAGAGDPELEIVEIPEAEQPKLEQSGTKHVSVAGVITVTPLPAPPIRQATGLVVDAVVRTTDDVLLEVFRLPTELKHVYRATLSMTAIDAGSGVTRDSEVRLVFKRLAAGLTQVGATNVLSNAQDAAASTWRIQPSVAGTDLVISVAGAAGRTVDWSLEGAVAVFAPEGLA